MAILITLAVAAFIFLLLRLQQRQKYLKKLEMINWKWGKPLDTMRDVRLIAPYHHYIHNNSSISDNIAADLDLDKVFAFADRTNSKPGQQYLYAQMRRHGNSADELLRLEALTEHLTSDRSTRQQIEGELTRLDGRNAYYLQELFTKSHTPLYTAALTFYIQFAHLIWIASLAATIVLHNQLLFILTMGLTLFNCYLHFSNKNKINRYVHSLPQLSLLITVARRIAAIIELPKTETVRQLLAKLKGLKRKLGVVSIEGNLSNDPTDLAYGIWELIKMLLVIEPRMFINSIKEVNQHREDIESIFEYVAEIDMGISIQSFRLSLPYYSMPQFTNDDKLAFTQLYHPLVEECVPNSFQTTANQGVLITGSNMSGKTTFIRAVAINTLLAQTLNTVCAESFHSPLLQICTSIRVSDDIEEHRSYFQAEALSVLEIMKKSETSRCLVIIDEIFRGTNTIERVAAAKSILSYLTAKRNFVFISTHDLELAELLGSEYAVYSFEEMVADKRLTFDYKIKPGILKNKNAIAILEAIGYPATVVSDAYRMSEQLRKKYKAD
jgi:hypothetical protein